jgi:hypothetical protein
MRYERPAIESRIPTNALLGQVSGGAADNIPQPIWRSTMHYEPPAIESRIATKAFLGRVSGGGGDLQVQPVWRSADTDTD